MNLFSEDYQKNAKKKKKNIKTNNTYGRGDIEDLWKI